MADVKPIVIKIDGNKTELSNSDNLMFPLLSGHPVSNPSPGYLYIYGLSGDKSMYQKDETGTVTKLTNNTGSSISKGSFDLDFGANNQESTSTTTVVADTSALSTSEILISNKHISTSDHDPDDYIWDEIITSIVSISNGVGFTVNGHAPNGSFGIYTFSYIIIN